MDGTLSQYVRILSFPGFNSLSSYWDFGGEMDHSVTDFTDVWKADGVVCNKKSKDAAVDNKSSCVTRRGNGFRSVASFCARF